MRNKRMTVLFGVAAVQVLAIGALSLTGGCKSQEVLTPRPYIPAPLTEPVVTQPVTNPPVIETVAPVIPPEIKTEPLKYTVKSGDSFWKIAREYGVSKEELAAFNKMSLQKSLKTGATLMIPPGGALLSPEKLASLKKAAPVKPVAPRPTDGTYTVVSNDSLSKIAAKHKIKTSALITANNLDPKATLQIGQKLVIPGAKANVAATAKTEATDNGVAPVAEPIKATTGPSDEEKLLNELEGKAPSTTSSVTEMTTESAPVATITYSEYEVSDGDTVEDIAGMYAIKAEDIRKANPGLPADGKLKAPMVLKIPEGSK